MAQSAEGDSSVEGEEAERPLRAFSETNMQVDLDSSPADFSFRKLKNITDLIGSGKPRKIRTGKEVPMNFMTGKLLTKSIWLNNNSLRSVRYISDVCRELFFCPARIQWIDLSFNNICFIDEELLLFKELKILYFHGNCIEDREEVAKLKSLKQLRTLTLHGCPIEVQPFYRQHIIYLLPHLKNLDHVTITPWEARGPPPPGAKS